MQDIKQNGGLSKCLGHNKKQKYFEGFYPIFKRMFNSYCYERMSPKSLQERWRKFEAYAKSESIQNHSVNDGEFEETVDFDVKLYMEMVEEDKSNEKNSADNSREANRSIQKDLFGNPPPLTNNTNRHQVAKQNKNDRNKNQPGVDLTTNTTPSEMITHDRKSGSKYSINVDISQSLGNIISTFEGDETSTYKKIVQL